MAPVVRFGMAFRGLEPLYALPHDMFQSCFLFLGVMVCECTLRVLALRIPFSMLLFVAHMFFQSLNPKR